MTSRRLLPAFLAFLLPFAAPAGYVRAEDEPVRDEDSPPLTRPAPRPAPKPAKKKSAAKRKAFDYERSKYKSLEPSQTPSYKFNEQGDPITADTKKKASAKKKKRSEPPEIGSRERAEGCGSDDNCAEKKSEADSL